MTITTSRVSILKLLLLCLIGFVVFSTVDRIVVTGLKRLLLVSHNRYLRVYQSEPAAKNVVLGNSRAGAHFYHSTYDQPQEFFNLGRGGMRLPISDVLIRDYIATHGKPSRVIIETSFLAEDGLGLDVVALTQIYSTRVRHLVWQNDPDAACLNDWFHTLQFNHNMFIPALAGLFWERESRIYRGQISPEVLRRINAWETFSLDLSAYNAQVLTDLLMYLQAQGIDVVMVMTPLLPERIRKINNLSVFLNDVQTLADAAGVRFVNLIDRVREHRYFADSQHLNQQGVARFLQAFWRQVDVSSRLARHAASS